MRRVGYEDLNSLCRGIKHSFVHLETRDAYGTEIESPQMAKWRRGETDDFAWLGWWLQMLRGHSGAGRTCRRARVVSEPLSDYQRWTMSHAHLFVDAGEDIRYVGRPQLSEVLLPGSGDFYVFDDETVLFLHYAGNGTNTFFEVTDDPRTVRACADAFEDVWKLTTPYLEYRPE
jgi:hypothetical protein